jgi:hypothetical protein
VTVPDLAHLYCLGWRDVCEILGVDYYGKAQT